MRTSLPRHEWDGFLMTVDEAVEAAQAGRAQEGYEALRGAHYRATAFLEDPDTAAWAAELVQRYEAALEQFAREWKIRPPAERPRRAG